MYQQNKLSLIPSKIKGQTAYECAYRGQDNTKCPIGFLISDEKYEKYRHEIEDFCPLDFSDTIIKELIIEENIKEVRKFLYDLQFYLHDQFNNQNRAPFNRDKLTKASIKLAEFYHLNMPKVSNESCNS